MTSTHFVLVPGHWLGGWAWDRVADRLRERGHHVTPVTLPGLEAQSGAARDHITLADHVDALAQLVSQAGPDVVLVAHSGAGAVVSGVLDRDPTAVRRVVYVDSGPSADDPHSAAAPASTGAVPLPSWAELSAGGASLEGLSEGDLAEFAARAVPHPAGAASGTQRLTNESRRQVPTTIIACSLPSAAVAELAANRHPMFAEVSALTDLEYVDLPTGHWPMWSKPDDLAAVLTAVAEH